MTHARTTKRALIARVHRIAGQVAAIERAISEDAGCSTVLQQVAAVRGAVRGLMDRLIEEHIQQYLAQPGLSDAERSEAADDIISAIRRFAK